LFLVPKELFTVLRVMRITVYYKGTLFYLTTIAGDLLSVRSISLTARCDVACRRFRMLHVNSHFGHHARYDSDKMPIRLAYDTTLPCVSRVISHTTADRITICSRHATTRQRVGMLCRLSLSRKHIATEGGDLTDIKKLC
jgi:hypothetical protein